MIFREWYGAYYNTVAKILKAAVERPLPPEEIRRIIRETAFGESILNIAPALEEERWQLLHRDGTTPLRKAPSMPMTTLQKRWLKAISLDPRIRLFGGDLPDLPDVDPLFTPEDYCVFDRYSDGDPYEDETYIRHFRLILDALRRRYPLSLHVLTRRGDLTYLVVMPEYLEYSEKDDKFRLITSGCRYGKTVNLGRITSCSPFRGEYRAERGRPIPSGTETVTFELRDERNALERALLHFAHFEKEAEKLDDHRYRVKIAYDRDDETEILIRILSFGPMVRVVSPQSFVDLIRNRLSMQKSCER